MGWLSVGIGHQNLMDTLQQIGLTYGYLKMINKKNLNLN